MSELVPVSQPGAPERFDVVVAGAGYVGLTAAVAIAQARPSLRVLLVDAAPEDAWRRDGRASAVAAAAVRLLDRLGAWEAIRDEAEPIREMTVTDSRTSDPVRPVLLRFGADREPGEPFARMVPNPVLNGALRARAEALGVPVRAATAVTAIEHRPATVLVHLSDGSCVEARLLVAADGVRSAIRDMAGIGTVHTDYGQSGIVATVAHERPHNGRAEEHFLPGGPFAVLPLKGNRSSIVWTEPTAEAERLLAADEMVFEIELEGRFGLKLGRLTLETAPRAFALGLTLARDFVRERVALVGDAAHGIHTVSASGGLDIGALDTLRRYERWRRFDTVRMGVTTDVLNRLFSNDSGTLRTLRSLGLSLVDRAPAAKRWFIEQAAGRAGADSSPRLLRGEAI